MGMGAKCKMHQELRKEEKPAMFRLNHIHLSLLSKKFRWVVYWLAIIKLQKYMQQTHIILAKKKKDAYYILLIYVVYSCELLFVFGEWKRFFASGIFFFFWEVKKRKIISTRLCIQQQSCSESTLYAQDYVFNIIS